MGDVFSGKIMPITVYFDGSCGICSREIGYYRRIADPGIFSWLDVSKAEVSLDHESFTRLDALKFLHVRDQAGNLHVGVSAFVVIWRQLRGWRKVAYLARTPGVNSLLEFCYRVFAKWRFARLGYCETGSINERLS